MTIKELSNYYSITKFDKGNTLLLYSLTEQGTISPNKYICHIIKVSDGVYMVPNMNPRNSISDILNDITEHLKTLKYNSEFYNYAFRKGYTDELIVNQYLKSIGFKYSNSINEIETYTLTRKNVYNGPREPLHLTVVGLNSLEKINEEVKIHINLEDYSFVESKCKRDADEIIKTIDALVHPLIITNSADDLKYSQSLSLQKADMLKWDIMNDFSIMETEIKAQVITKLKETLAVLER